MNELLAVRLSSEQQIPISWVVWSLVDKQVISSGELDGWDSLADLKPHAEQRAVVICIAASDVVFAEVEIPAGAARQFESMLPYLIEDEVAQDVEQLHFTVLDKQGSIARICGIDKTWLSHILQRFSAQDIVVQRVLPDVLVIPIAEQGATAVAFGDQWLIRHDEFSGVAVDESWLAIYLAAYQVKGSSVATVSAAESAANESTSAESKSEAGDISATQNANTAADKPYDIHYYSDIGGLNLSDSTIPELVSGNAINWLPVTDSPSLNDLQHQTPMALLAQGIAHSKLTLLTGIFKPKSSWGKYWKIWQGAAIAVALLLVTLIVKQSVVLHESQAQVHAYHNESERIFRKVFPEKRRIPTVSYLKRQMEQERVRLAGGTDDNSLFTWIMLLPESIGQVKGISITNLKYDMQRKELRLQAQSADFQTFEKARVQLTKQFQVEQGQLNKNGNIVLGSFVLTRK